MKQQFTYDVMGITDNIGSGNTHCRKTKKLTPIAFSLLDTDYAFGKKGIICVLDSAVALPITTAGFF